MAPAAIKAWSLVHKWTSLICTLFLLMLCLTGLPLIFADEIEAALGHSAELEVVPPGTARPGLDRIVASALAARSGEVVQYLYTEPDSPVVMIGTAPRADSPDDRIFVQPFDQRTGRPLPLPPQREGFLFIMERRPPPPGCCSGRASSGHSPSVSQTIPAPSGSRAATG